MNSLLFEHDYYFSFWITGKIDNRFKNCHCPWAYKKLRKMVEILKYE